MKKNLFYVFALICSMSLFTACSDDDDNSWKELPKGEITADNVELQLNGTNTTGTVTFEASSTTAAKVGLKNVIDGYSDIDVDVTMTEQPDGSFNLNGTKKINTKPVTKAAATPAPYLTVIVTGTITKEGKLTLGVNASGTGLYIGEYSGNTLILNYGGEPVIGKTVVFDATDAENATILLTDVIPNEATTTLTGITLDERGFSGTVTTSTDAKISYTGSRADKVLTLNLDVTLNDPKSWAGNYSLTSYAFSGTPKAPVIDGGLYLNWPYGGLMGGFDTQVKAIVSMVLPQVLKTVSLHKDGNITAGYNEGALNLSQEMMMDPLNNRYVSTEDYNKSIPTTGWVASSPKNLAYWFEKQDTLYVKLNISTLIAQAMGGDGSLDLSAILPQILNGSPTTIKALLNALLGLDSTEKNAVTFSNVSDATIEMLLDWVKNGIPMLVDKKENSVNIYLDGTILSPLLVPNSDLAGETGKVSDLEVLWAILVKKGIIPQEASGVRAILSFVAQTHSYGFEIGLSLQAE